MKLAQNSTKTHAAVVTFVSRSAVVELLFPHKFNLEQFNSTIDRIRPYMYSGLFVTKKLPPRIEESLEKTRRLFNMSSRQHVPRIAILIATVADLPDNALMRNAAFQLKQESVRIFVVCVFTISPEKSQKIVLGTGIVERKKDLIFTSSDFDEMNDSVNNQVTKVLLAIGKNKRG